MSSYIVLYGPLEAFSINDKNMEYAMLNQSFSMRDFIDFTQNALRDSRLAARVRSPAFNLTSSDIGLFALPLTLDDKRVCGLLIQADPEEPGAYTRIGVFDFNVTFEEPSDTEIISWFSGQPRHKVKII